MVMKLPEAALFRVLSWLETNLDQEISVSEAAKIACYSPYHFNRLFKRFTGEDFGAYVKRLRLETGAFLLKTGRSVTETAFTSGYWTHEAFTRAFKSTFGRSPRNFSLDTMPKDASDTYVDKPRKILWPGLRGYRKRVMGPYGATILPKRPGSPWPPQGGRFFGISWDDPNVTPQEKIRYDALWTGTPTADSQPMILEAGPYLTALHHGDFLDLPQSYNYLLYAAPKLWGVTVHPRLPPFEEVLDHGFQIYIPLLK